MYKAIIDIGDYKEGDTVPDVLAIVWDKMYKISPVKIVDGKEEIKSEPKGESTNAMEDDYLNRNKHVVKKNLEEDNFDEATLNRLLNLEEANKNRSSIINLIISKIGDLDGE